MAEITKMEAFKVEEIKRRQTMLFEAFGHEGVYGGKHFAPVVDREQEVGAAFNHTYHGSRILTDCFLDFLGGTLLEQIELNNEKGWPQAEANYATCVLMYLTVFRSVRASDVCASNAYPLQGYIIQRSIKDQALILCAAANNLADFATLFGWKGLPDDKPWTDEDNKAAIKNRRTIENQIREKIIGSKSGLKDETIKLLIKLDGMFNTEAHRGLFTLFGESRKLLVEHNLDLSLVSGSNMTGDTMFVNRATETNWMIHRLVPFMRRKDTPHNEAWDKNWKLLDEHFRWMVEGFGAIGKDVAPAYLEMIDAKFKFDAGTYYTEPTG
ncbi:hypothetical protein I8G32_02350 [Rhodopseudomonas palustris]|nr:hypothetical protein [Rhodopseudomonas palustris]OPF90443.1 hypothetical protein B1S06_24045 [Rhodopseudomonas palustris]QQM03807.1 hypothetical protein I8G32_02350 [Rhodopseudomonas palustris]RJF62202.1 hypothetical protein D4Q71_19185 [Rhodopseudomonas palustris]WAB79945.1 hypothetical protein OR798_11830 [Rhodopseudomonas palustris]WCL92448.1 hypothetical protein TX73_011825 [Rhodopseudomonas palustris CGA009]